MRDYRHLRRMTDATGIIQFSKWDEPDVNSGYTVDDNARALLVALNIHGEEGEKYTRIYTNFLHSAQRPDGTWCNLMVNGTFTPEIDSEDSWGRAFLACIAAASSHFEDIRRLALEMAVKALPVVMNLKFPRPIAYTLIGLQKGKDIPELQEHHKAMRETAARYSEDLISLYNHNKSPGWYWFEDRITFCNGIMPQALFAYYSLTSDKKALMVAKESLSFLNDNLFAKGYLNIVGNRGWWLKGNFMPLYDQQPVDACSTALACLEAYAATGQKEYVDYARQAYSWYFGENINNTPLYNHKTGGCHDGLIPTGVNPNQGAEALISMLLTELALEKLGFLPETKDGSVEGKEHAFTAVS
ncbi:MAG: hypothetical protein ACPLTR_10295 [Thermacetogeniaceae bacterium]